MAQTLKAIQQVAPSLHCTIRIKFHDYIPGGVATADAITACKLFEAQGIHSIEIRANETSCTGSAAWKNEKYFSAFARQLKQVVSTPVILVGGHCGVLGMGHILQLEVIEYFRYPVR